MEVFSKKSCLFIILACCIFQCTQVVEADNDNPCLCSDGWTCNPQTGKCYKFIKKLVTWSKAHRDCQKMSPTKQFPYLPVTRGHLVSIANKEENEFVVGLTGGLMAWLGGTKLADKTWIWTDGQKWTYDTSETHSTPTHSLEERTVSSSGHHQERLGMVQSIRKSIHMFVSILI